MKPMPPTGLYVHIPFCWRRCAYCDFVSSVYDPGTADAYLEALSKEEAARAQGFAPETLYVGGGTPTSLDLAQIETLVRTLASMLDTRALQEYTIEANPGTLTMEKLLLLKAAGVTRVSLGVQTFSADGLRLLGRIHDAKQARGSVAMLREAGFDQVSLDLIYGWPGQTQAHWADDLAQALDIDVPHLSCYALSIEPGTELHALHARGALHRLSEDEARALFDQTHETLAAHGRPAYEISSFCQPGSACLHNVNYWTGGEYIGLGAGAHSHEAGLRHANTSDIATYIDSARQGRSARVFEERLEPQRRARECAVLWLRLRNGIDAKAFAARTGFGLTDLLGEALPPLVADGWLEWDDDHTHLRVSDQALPTADSVLAELVG